MWETRRLTILWASTACYRDSCTFFFALFKISLPNQARILYQEYNNNESEENHMQRKSEHLTLREKTVLTGLVSQ
jgi:hypothetical protein